MKKLEVGFLESLEEKKIKLVEFLKRLDLDSISTVYVRTEEVYEFNTDFRFETNKGQEITFTYRKNQFISDISIWEEGKFYLGMIFPLEEEKEKNGG